MVYLENICYQGLGGQAAVDSESKVLKVMRDFWWVPLGAFKEAYRKRNCLAKGTRTLESEL